MSPRRLDDGLQKKGRWSRARFVVSMFQAPTKIKAVVAQNGKLKPKMVSASVYTSKQHVNNACGHAVYLPHAPIPRPLDVQGRGLRQRFLCTQSEIPGRCMKGMHPFHFLNAPLTPMVQRTVGAPFCSCVPSASAPQECPLHLRGIEVVSRTPLSCSVCRRTRGSGSL